MGGDNFECLSTLKQYLQQEYLAKKGGYFDGCCFKTLFPGQKLDDNNLELNLVKKAFYNEKTSTNHSYSIVKNLPQQQNGSDCGVFACEFAERLAREDTLHFNPNTMPKIRQRMTEEILANSFLVPRK